MLVFGGSFSKQFFASKKVIQVPSHWDLLLFRSFRLTNDQHLTTSPRMSVWKMMSQVRIVGPKSSHKRISRIPKSLEMHPNLRANIGWIFGHFPPTTHEAGNGTITTCMGKDRISNSAKRMACALCKYLPGLTKGGEQKTGDFRVVEGIGKCFFSKIFQRLNIQRLVFSDWNL